MARRFEVPLTTSPEAIITKAREYSKNDAIAFEGDTGSGRFSVYGVEGQYAIRDGSVVVDIHHKPFLVPWSMVETQVREFFS